MDVVDADALVNQAIEARARRDAQRQNIQVQRERLGQQLRGTNRKDRGQIYQLRSQLQGLDQAERNINSDQRYEDNTQNRFVQASFRNAHLSQEALNNQRHDQTAKQVTNINNGLTRLEAKYPNRGYDSDQAAKFSAEVEQLGNENLMGKENKTAANNLFKASQFLDLNRQRILNIAAKKLSDLTKGGLSPEEFANRDHSKDFTTNATDLASAQSDDLNVSKRPKKGEPIGVNTVFNAGGANWMLPTTSFSHFDSNFTKQPTAQTAPVTPDQNNGIQPLVPTYGGQGAAPPGGLVRNYDGSITPIVPTYGGEGAAPPGALVRTGVAQIGTPPPTGVPKEEQINPTATLPTDVQPNQPLQPVAQLGTQPMANAPQVAQQPTQIAPTIRVTHPDGRTGTIPASQLPDALKNGYQQVQ
jgi:hypothetical protein